MAAMRSSATTGAGLVQPLSARVAAFRPVSRSQKNSVVGQAVPECKQTAQKLAAFGALTSSLAAAGSAQAADLAAATSAVSGDNRAALLATLFIPALGWVAYNILGPALNQYENMRLKGAAAGIGITAASLLYAEQADAVNQVSELAAGDNRALILGVIFVPALGWVAFNILGPALNQLANMGSQNARRGGRRR